MLNRQWFGDRDQDRTPLVLLHEGLGSLRGWVSFAQDLADRSGHPVLSYDRAGYGESPTKPGPWPASFLHDGVPELAGLLAEESLDEVILVGHSDGASIALLYPSLAPTGFARLRGVVSLSAHLFVEAKTVAEIQSLRRSFADDLRPPLSRQHRHVDALFEAWSSAWVSDRFRSWTIDTEVASVTCPVLAFQGDKDAFATWEQIDRLVAATSGPIEVIRLAGVNHWPHREATDEVLTAAAGFVAGLP